MKLKTGFMMSALSLALSGTVFAADYYPPERINCRLNRVGKLSCEYLDRRYVVESEVTVNVQPGRDQVFHFTSAVAYFNLKQATVYFAYGNSDKGLVNLKTINGSFHPNWVSKNWRKSQEDIYVCDAGYMQCSVTDKAK